MENVRFKKLTPFATTPSRGTPDSAGYDLYSAQTIEVAPGGCIKVPTDIAIEIPKDYFGGIYPRSGLSTKKGLRLANCVGVVDADYRGGVIVAIYNDSDEVQVIERGDRIAQLIIQPYLNVRFELVDELEETERGSGGFGSTGS